MDLTWKEACGRRLARHGLAAEPLRDGPAGAAAAMCGAHAQVLSAAEVSVGLRVAGVTRSGVQDALWSEHSLVKTFGPRGTVHLLPAAELALWCGALTAARPPRRLPPELHMTAEQTDELVLAIGTVLADAEVTVAELTEVLAGQLGSWAVDPVVPAFQEMWPRWRLVTEIAAFRGVLCYGPARGRTVTYTSPARWLPGFTPAPPAEASGWLLARYLHAYGPATPEHFARWLGTTPGWAKSLFSASRLTEVTIEGARAWVADGDTRPGEPAQGVLLLPHFDPFTVGSQPRGLLFRGAARDRALSRGQAGNFPVLLIDGVVAGIWQQRRTAAKVAITVEPLRPLTHRERRELDGQVERIGAIQEAQPALTLGPITSGAHA